MFKNKNQLVSKEHALKGRENSIIDPSTLHLVLKHPLNYLPANENEEIALFAMGCFWGAERLFWQQKGVITTAVVYCGGFTPNPTYEEVCTNNTGHAEGVRIVFDNRQISYHDLLNLFWLNHDPTQGMRQKNDVGTQYRSAIFYFNDTQKTAAIESKLSYNNLLSAQKYPNITTSIEPHSSLYYAEKEHQQYLFTHPNGYCSLGGLNLKHV